MDLKTGEQTLAQISDSILLKTPGVKEVSFQTLDGAVIPGSELLKHRNNIPFIMSLKRDNGKAKNNYAINLNEGFVIGSGAGSSGSSKTSEEAYLEYCLGIGLPRYPSFLLANFASKLHQTLPAEHTVKNEAILKGLQQTMSYFRSVGNHDSMLKVSDIERMLDERQHELIKLTETKSKLDKKADFRSRALLTLGSTFFMAQFGFIMSGTFVYYSWDVMEPVSYVMMLGNFTAGMFFYAAYKDEMQLATLKEMLSKRFARGIYKRRGFDIERLENLEEEIRELRAILNKSVN